MARNKEKKNKVFIIFIIAVFILSTVGSVVIYYGNEDTNSVTLSYGDRKFKFQRNIDSQGMASYDVTSKDASFTAFYLPTQLNINVDQITQSILKDSTYFYFTFDPGQEELSIPDFLRYDIRNNMPQSRFFIDAVTEETELYPLPVITCANATLQSPVVFIREANETKVWSEGSCMKIEYARQSALQVRDMLVYLLNGIDIG